MWKRRQSYWAAIILCLSQLSASVTAAQTQPAGPSAGDKPIDIQANEQEFAGDIVIAKGNVKVTYKDCVVYAPQAKLFRTPDGQPQKAIFVGHPHLTQGINKMDADTLEFEIASGQIIADGHSHSEVSSAGDQDKKDDDQGESKAKTGAGGTDETADSTAADTATTGATAKAKKKAPPKSTRAQAPEMIITDADHQEYIKEGGKFEAKGHVHLKTGDIVVRSDKLQLMYGTDNKPEAAIFVGNVNATQFDNNTLADNMTYFLSTQRLQATGNVRSKVIQKNDGKKGGPSSGPKVSDAELDPSALGDVPDDQVIILTSDAQDYTKDSGRIAAQGNVHLKCGDISGFGPNVLVLRRDDGSADKVLFTGRSQINQPGRRWIGDRITVNVLDHKVLAEGNTRAIIVSPPKTASSQAPVATPANAQEQLATPKSPEREKPI